MPDYIHLLPDAIANQIAAGEVIQRPASAVKELLENAIDAGSTEIQLIISDAGKALIQVVDNGCGMSETDARMSFERHATSKIKTAEDLFNIRSMGFRGEALASIAAISHVELKTRKHEDPLGTRIVIEGSEVIAQEACQCNPGTSIAIKNLFYNTPARRNFLKSKTVETRHILDEFQRIALAHPNISFRVLNNNIETYHLLPGNMRKRIVGVFGSNYNERLVPVEESTSVINITGFIGKPDFAKKTRGEQYFFVNNRYIKSPYLNHAIVNAFEDLIPSSAYPLYVLMLDIDPARIDINVHPTKQEIKFEDERIIYAYLRSAVKRALGHHSLTPTLDFEREPGITDFLKSRKPSDSGYAGQASPGGPFQATQTAKPTQKETQAWQELYAISRNKDKQTITLQSNWDKPEPGLAIEMENTQVVPYQLHKRLIISPIKSGMIIIDQQAAHERVLYERFMAAFGDKPIASQQQLFPKKLELNTADFELLKDLHTEINRMGFDIQAFGGNDFVVHGIPVDITEMNIQEVIEGILEQFKQHNESMADTPRNNLARALASQACIKTGQGLSAKEMIALMDELFACQEFYKAPNGRQTFISISLDELRSQFDKKE